MGEKEIAIIDAILKYMVQNSGKFNSYSDTIHLEIKSDESEKVYHILDTLSSRELFIKRDPRGNKTAYITTELGKQYAESGVQGYFDKIEMDKQLEKKVKTATIEGIEIAKKTAKTSRNIAIIAIIISIVMPTLVVFLERRVNNVEKTGMTNMQEKINSQIALQLADTSFIEKIKDSLKSDTAFLKELGIRTNK